MGQQEARVVDVEEHLADGMTVELRGVLESLSARFWGGWGFGALQTDSGAVVKIVGALEGHVVGTSLLVRGVYKQSNYGRQLDCSSIVVDSVSGEMPVIRAWARKCLKDDESAVVWAMRSVPASERWAVLSDAERLAGVGVERELAGKVALLAAHYLTMIEAKKGLMQLGFSDKEADALCGAYGGQVFDMIEQDPYGIVIARVLPFGRMDVVVNGAVPRNDRRRLHAAMVQALVGGLRNGHTAMPKAGVIKEAADLAGVNRAEAQRAGIPEDAVVAYDGQLQLCASAEAEEDVATWVRRAMEKL